jgi:hypothetical protein
LNQDRNPRSNGGSAAGVASATTVRPATDFRPADTTDVPTSFTLQGRIEGLVAPDFAEPLEGARVRLYRPRGAPEETAARAAALPKDTFAILTENQAMAKTDDLLAEADVDATGRFEVVLGGGQRYGGEAFEIDVYCGTVPRLPPRPRPPRPVQLSLTTLQPRWRMTAERGAIAAWEFTVPSRFWCAVRSRFDAWVVCGHVRAGAANTPVPNVRVHALDVDWLQNDALGSAMTDAAGRYRIDYGSDDFTPTIFPGLRLEWVSGPDLYFRVETGGGAALLTEPPGRGRDADRQNVGQCKVVDLHLDTAPGGGDGTETQPITSFFQIGRYHVTTGIASAPTGSGRSLHAVPALAGRAFFETLPLRGVLGKRMPLSADPLEYRFEFAEYGAGSTTEPTTFAAVPLAMIGETHIGTLQLFDPGAPTPDQILVNKRVLVNGPPGAPPPGADYVNADVVGGWIRVPQNDNINAAAGGLFVANTGRLADLASPALTTFETIDCTQLQAGEAAQSEGRVVPREHFFTIRMVVRKWGDATTQQEAGRVHRVAISNPTYTNITRHAEWNPTPAFSAFAVTMVDLGELAGMGCAHVTGTLTPSFTAAHPNMGAVSMRLEGGPTPAQPFTVPASPSPADRFGVGAPSGWSLPLPPCSYLVRVSAEVRVTTGEAEPAAVEDYIGFCT